MLHTCQNNCKLSCGFRAWKYTIKELWVIDKGSTELKR